MFAVQRMARETVRALHAAGLDLTAGARGLVIRYALGADSSAGINGITRMARYLPGITVSLKGLDVNRDVLNVRNGTLDLQTFTLGPHRPTEMLTRLVDVPYEPSATAPTWQKFLDEVFQHEPALIEFVQRCVGYTLTGSIKEQVVFFLHGAGSNGKSTFVDLLSTLLGDYSTNAGKETFLASRHNEGRGPEPELIAMSGKRFAHVDEADEGRLLDEGRIKSLTGGATYSGRDLYKSTETFDNTAKVWFDLNKLPGFTGIDYGIERRLLVIPFDRTFHPEEKDLEMLDKLKAELPGILAWAVEGCRAWRQRDLSTDRPSQVSLATRRYRDEQNHLPAFIEETYLLDPTGQIGSKQIQADYRGFCAQREEPPLEWREKVVPYLRDVRKLTSSHKKTGTVWQGLVPRQSVDEPGEPSWFKEGPL